MQTLRSHLRPTEPGNIFKQDPHKIPMHTKVWKARVYTTLFDSSNAAKQI